MVGSAAIKQGWSANRKHTYFFWPEDPDEMTHKAAFHQGLQCLLRQDRSSKK